MMAPRTGRPRKGEGVDPESVLETAAEVFATRGYTGTTLEEVGRRLGVTRQSILHHYSTKQDLFHAVLERDRRWAERSALSVADGHDVGDLFAPLARFLGADDEARQRIRLQHVLQGEAIAGDPTAQEFIALRTRVIREQIRARVQAAADRGILSPERTVDGAATALFALVNGLQALSLIDPTADLRTPFDEVIATLLADPESAQEDRP